MTKIIAKNVEHRYSPRVPNRTEPREFDRYSIYIANNHCKVDLWSVYKKGEEILHTILIDKTLVFPLPAPAKTKKAPSVLVTAFNW